MKFCPHLLLVALLACSALAPATARLGAPSLPSSHGEPALIALHRRRLAAGTKTSACGRFAKKIKAPPKSKLEKFFVPSGKAFVKKIPGILGEIKQSAGKSAGPVIKMLGKTSTFLKSTAGGFLFGSALDLFFPDTSGKRTDALEGAFDCVADSVDALETDVAALSTRVDDLRRDLRKTGKQAEAQFISNRMHIHSIVWGNVMRVLGHLRAYTSAASTCVGSDPADAHVRAQLCTCGDFYRTFGTNQAFRQDVLAPWAHTSKLVADIILELSDEANTQYAVARKELWSGTRALVRAYADVTTSVVLATQAALRWGAQLRDGPSGAVGVCEPLAAMRALRGALGRDVVPAAASFLRKIAAADRARSRTGTTDIALTQHALQCRVSHVRTSAKPARKGANLNGKRWPSAVEGTVVCPSATAHACKDGSAGCTVKETFCTEDEATGTCTVGFKGTRVLGSKGAKLHSFCTAPTPGSALIGSEVTSTGSIKRYQYTASAGGRLTRPGYPPTCYKSCIRAEENGIPENKCSLAAALSHGAGVYGRWPGGCLSKADADKKEGGWRAWVCKPDRDGQCLRKAEWTEPVTQTRTGSQRTTCTYAVQEDPLGAPIAVELTGAVALAEGLAKFNGEGEFFAGCDAGRGCSGARVASFADEATCLAAMGDATLCHGCSTGNIRSTRGPMDLCVVPWVARANTAAESGGLVAGCANDGCTAPAPGKPARKAAFESLYDCEAAGYPKARCRICSKSEVDAAAARNAGVGDECFVAAKARAATAAPAKGFWAACATTHDPLILVSATCPLGRGEAFGSKHDCEASANADASTCKLCDAAAIAAATGATDLCLARTAASAHGMWVACHNTACTPRPDPSYGGALSGRRKHMTFNSKLDCLQGIKDGPKKCALCTEAAIDAATGLHDLCWVSEARARAASPAPSGGFYAACHTKACSGDRMKHGTFGTKYDCVTMTKDAARCYACDAGLIKRSGEGDLCDGDFGRVNSQAPPGGFFAACRTPACSGNRRPHGSFVYKRDCVAELGDASMCYTCNAALIARSGKGDLCDGDHGRANAQAPPGGFFAACRTSACSGNRRKGGSYGDKRDCVKATGGSDAMCYTCDAALIARSGAGDLCDPNY